MVLSNDDDVMMNKRNSENSKRERERELLEGDARERDRVGEVIFKKVTVLERERECDRVIGKGRGDMGEKESFSLITENYCQTRLLIVLLCKTCLYAKERERGERELLEGDERESLI